MSSLPKKSSAFAGSPDLAYVFIPESVTTIASSAFDQVTGLTVIGAAGSAAEELATAQGFTFVEGIASEVEFVFFGD